MQSRVLGFIGLTLSAMAAAIAVSATSITPVQAHDDPAKPEYYSTHVKPIFDANCARCHSGINHRGGLNFDARESLLKGGHSGKPAVIPGDPANSQMVILIRHDGPKEDPMDMPPHKDKLSDADIQTITDWIKAGAPMPRAAAQ